MASYLGWNFVTIDTACFLADGLESIAARMRYVFERLQALDRTIILFDEIEEFCLDRENPALGMESRMLTTAMLTQVGDAVWSAKEVTSRLLVLLEVKKTILAHVYICSYFSAHTYFYSIVLYLFPIRL